MRTALGFVIFLCAACGSGPNPGGDRDASVAPSDSGVLDAGADAGQRDAGAPPLELEIRVDDEGGFPDRLYCLASTGDAGVALLIDTGSQLTFLSLPPGSPDFVADAGVLWLGNLQLTLPGRPYAVNESVEGRPVIGTLGTDFLLAATTELDLVAQRLRRLEGPFDAGAFVGLPYEDVQGFIYARVRIDAFDVRLGVDTGSPDMLLLDAGPQPRDQQVTTMDAYGNMLTLYLGSGELSYSGLGPYPVPVLRTRSFPSLEDSNRLVGGEIDGLFGLSSWPGEHLVFEPRTHTLWFSVGRDGG